MNLRDDARIPMDGLTHEIRVDADASNDDLDVIRKAAVEFSPNATSVAHGAPVTGSVKRLQEQ